MTAADLIVEEMRKRRTLKCARCGEEFQQPNTMATKCRKCRRKWSNKPRTRRKHGRPRRFGRCGICERRGHNRRTCDRRDP